ncbi:MAG: HAD family phosphatase [Candidatus Marinimicrobia bacterium]|nr:HAD family phosphatase [Candidatus Neomarinimicrobiota bacterium]
MNKPIIKIVFTDLDGTLLNSSGMVSEANLKMLHQLKQKNILRVLATGRNLYSLSKVISADFPVDYVIFSTGVGIMNWKTKQLVHTTNLEEKQIQYISRILIKNNQNFMLQWPFPENHRFYYLKNGRIGEDFQRRIELYKEFAQPVEQAEMKIASQFLTIFDDLESFNRVKKQLEGVKVVRATSPLDYKSIWMEIFHDKVCKGMGCQWLCHHLNVNRMHTIGIGNDFNDLDMLHWTAHSFVVENSHAELKADFKVTNHHDNHAFHEVLKDFV